MISHQQMIAILTLLVITLVAQGHAWGFMGHRLTAAVAEAFLQPETASAVKQLLRGENLTAVASWADEIKRQPRYRWTSSLHYSNPKDNEPAQCGYDYHRDCPDQKCVVGAIYNFSSVVDPHSSKDREVRAEALKFLTHFVGDLHQPLHVSGRDKGGNLATARFDGALSNLHSIWDSSMIQKRIVTKFDGNFRKYLDHILGRVRKEWANELPRWILCQRNLARPALILNYVDEDIQPEITTGFTCPDSWAIQVNRFDCSAVWLNYTAGAELGGEYYEKNILLVEQLLAMGGIRLAAILNGFYK